MNSLLSRGEAARQNSRAVSVKKSNEHPVRMRCGSEFWNVFPKLLWIGLIIFGDTQKGAENVDLHIASTCKICA